MSIRSIITDGLGGFARWLIKSKFDLADNDSTTPPPPPPPQIPGNGIFTRPWGPLITNGLGTSACCGLLLAGMGAWQCFVGITPPPPSGGGGGGGIASGQGVYIPWPPNIKKKPKTRVVKITVIASGKKWERAYVIDEKHANLTVRVINVINKTSSKIAIGVGKIDKARKSVVATFRNK